MKRLIKVQSTIKIIEETTLESKFHSFFDYKDGKNLVIKTFCWEQASTYKNIFNRMEGIIVYIESNSTIRIYEMEDEQGEE